MNFPLYDNLREKLKTKDLLVREKTHFIDMIKKIDKDGQELLYALIRYHYNLNADKNNQDLPYEGKYVNETLCFDLDKFPIELKQILYKFIQIHIKKMEEETKLNQSRY